MKGDYDNAESSLRTFWRNFRTTIMGTFRWGFSFLPGQDSFSVDSFRKAKALNPSDLRASKALVALFNSGEISPGPGGVPGRFKPRARRLRGTVGVGPVGFGRGLSPTRRRPSKRSQGFFRQPRSPATARGILLRGGEFRSAEDASPRSSSGRRTTLRDGPPGALFPGKEFHRSGGNDFSIRV